MAKGSPRRHCPWLPRLAIRDECPGLTARSAGPRLVAPSSIQPARLRFPRPECEGAVFVPARCAAAHGLEERRATTWRPLGQPEWAETWARGF